MANLGNNFDASQVAPPSFELLPKGDYTLRIVESDVVENSAKTGTLLKLTLEVVEGQFTGKKLFDQLNLSNPSEMAVKIGRERLSGYCHAVGVIQLQDSAQLHGIPFTGRVKIKVDKNGDYDDRNEIASVKKLVAAPAGSQIPSGFAQGGMPQQGAQQQPAFNTAPPGQYGQPAGNPQGTPQGFIQPQQQTQSPQGFGQPAQGFVQPNQQTQPAQGFGQPTSPVDNTVPPAMGFQQQAPVEQQQVQQAQVAQQQPANGGVQKAPWEM